MRKWQTVYYKLEKETHFLHGSLETQNVLLQWHSFTTPQMAILGYINTNNENESLINHLFLIFQTYFYFARDTGVLNWKIKEKIAKNNTRKTQEFFRKMGSSAKFMNRLTHFSPMSHFYTSWKPLKTYGFLTFSGGIEMWHWTKMG